jgi:gliding motility-associated-like protein
VGTYVVRIGNKYNCYNIDTILVENRCAPKLYVPNAFSPTEEGENKTHKVFGYNIGFFELLIFNRWGEIIYKSNDIHKPWNGYYLEELMPSGVYSWVIKYAGNNPDHKNVEQLDGKVVLVR